jgi:hypothetical protein
MKKLCLIPLIGALILCPAGLNAQKSFKLAEPVNREFNNIVVCVSPQVELISVIQTIGKYPSVLGFLMSKDSSDYKNDVLNHFEKFRDHPAVLMFDRLSIQPRMLNFSAPSNIMLYTDKNLELRNDIKLDEFVINRAGGADSLKLMLGLLRDFAIKTSFNDFFKSHNSYYLSIVENTGKNLGKINYPKEVENFFGKTQKSYNIILVSMYNFVGFGNSLLFSDGKREIYNTMGPRSVVDDLPFFGDEAYLKYMIRHEFSHPFVNPLTEKYWHHIKDYSANYDSIPEAARKNVCGDWQECINEFMIRAVTTQLAFNESEEAGSSAYKKEASRGVSYLDRLLGMIKNYQSDRNKYKTFDSYYLNMLEVFKNESH